MVPNKAKQIDRVNIGKQQESQQQQQQPPQPQQHGKQRSDEEPRLGIDIDPSPHMFSPPTPKDSPVPMLEIYKNPNVNKTKKKPYALYFGNSENDSSLAALEIEQSQHYPHHEPLLPPIQTNTSKSSSQSPSSTSPNFDFITKLPTPVIGTAGAFSAFQSSPPRFPYDELEVRKQHAIGRIQNRVLSEYRPSFVAERSAHRLSEVTHDKGKRYISNPQELQQRARDTDSENDKDGTSSKEQSAEPDTLEGSVFSGTLHPNQYRYVRQIGSGSFSKVVLAEDNVTDKPIAIKIIDVPHRNKDEVSNFKSFIKRELFILFQLNHPNIIKLIDYKVNLRINVDTGSGFTSDDEDGGKSSSEEVNRLGSISDEEFSAITKKNNQQFMFLEYSKGGNLFEFSSRYYNSEVEDRKHTSVRYWRVIERVVHELLNAVGYLHKSNIIHRDIKLENILLNYEPEELLRDAESSDAQLTNIICLTDFGLSKKVSDPDQPLQTRCGSEDYISPELLMGLTYNGQLTDTWSIGVVIYSLLENRLPFDLPPMSTMLSQNSSSGISPSVLKRQRNKNKTPHRIAMIDWGWFKVTDMLNDEAIGEDSKEIIKRLQSLTDKILVRKQNRPKVLELLEGEQ